MKNKNEAISIVKILKNTYPDTKCSLDFNTPFQLAVAVALSAQCTDERVNLITPTLFEKCKTIEDFANIDINELEKLIHSCGFYKNKAKNIKKCANQVLEKFNGVLPQNMYDLISLSGIGRKSANVIMLEAFDNPQGIAVDTHVKRISNLIGLSKSKDPIKIEQDLLKIYPKEYIKDINHLFIWHGRNICIARKPNCEKCPIFKYCDFYKSKNILTN